MLKPQDVVISIKLLQVREGAAVPTYAELAMALKMSPSEAHAGVRRAVEVGLLRRSIDSPNRMPLPVRMALGEFLVSGLKYVWPGEFGAAARGIPTCTSVPSVASELGVPESARPLVWRHPLGTMRGETVGPLYPKLPEVCIHDPWLHTWLALVDILRCQTGREASLAANTIQRRLS